VYVHCRCLIAIVGSTVVSEVLVLVSLVLVLVLVRLILVLVLDHAHPVLVNIPVVHLFILVTMVT